MKQSAHTTLCLVLQVVGARPTQFETPRPKYMSRGLSKTQNYFRWRLSIPSYNESCMQITLRESTRALGQGCIKSKIISPRYSGKAATGRDGLHRLMLDHNRSQHSNVGKYKTCSGDPSELPRATHQKSPAIIEMLSFIRWR